VGLKNLLDLRAIDSDHGFLEESGLLEGNSILELLQY
jgi:hypothetical protein